MCIHASMCRQAESLDRRVLLQGRDLNSTICLQAAKILKNVLVQQLSLYWKASCDGPPSKTPSMESDAWQHVEHPAKTAGAPAAASSAHQPSADTQNADDSMSGDGVRPDMVLLPTKCELTISMSSDKHTGVTHIGADAKVDRLQVQLHKEQISDMSFVQDQYAVWMLRNRYAALRPTGWRSTADKVVPSRQVASGCNMQVAMPIAP